MSISTMMWRPTMSVYDILDQQIVREQKEILKGKFLSLGSVIYIREKRIKFTRQEIAKEYSILLPIQCEPLKEEQARIKYSSSFRAQQLFTIQELDADFGFNLLPIYSQIKSIDLLATGVKETLAEGGSEIVALSECMRLEKTDGCWFDFYTDVKESAVYNMMLLGIVEGNILHFSFNCPAKDYYEWNSVVLGIWDTLVYRKCS